MQNELLRSRSRRVKNSILGLAFYANKGHIGSALSIADIMAVVATLRFEGDDPKHDALVLSKGHAASALFAALMDLGIIPNDQTIYCADGSEVATHPMASTPGVDFSTGSLGQGITYAVGAALAARLAGRGGRVWCVISDAELNEGSTWEAAQIAASQRLGRLVVVLDLNGQQATARTDDVMPTGFVPSAWEAMGWEVIEVDGHDVGALLVACTPVEGSTRPRLVVARTTSGKGVSFMEGQIAWHYLPMTEDQYSQALAEISSAAP